MTTFVTLDRNPGPHSVDQNRAPACVVLRSPSVEVSLPYDDLDTLNETIALFVEARDQLTKTLIERFGQAVPAISIDTGWEIVIDGTIVEVVSVLVHGDVVGVSYPPRNASDNVREWLPPSATGSKYREFRKDGAVTRIVRPADPLAELQADVVR